MQHRTHKPYPGFFITVEGGEGSGKSTLCQTLSEQLQKKGHQVLLTREPGGTALSESLRALLLNTPSGVQIGSKAELLIYLAARMQHLEEKILPALHQGFVVICDRFNDSSVAYQGVARGLGMEYVEKLCRHTCEELDPDCTFFLDLDPEVGMMRLQKNRSKDRLEQEHLQFHQAVRSGFLQIADSYPDRVCILDATLSAPEVAAAALSTVEERLIVKPRKL